MKKAVTLAAIASIALASDFEDNNLMAHPSGSQVQEPNKALINLRPNIFFDDDEFFNFRLPHDFKRQTQLKGAGPMSNVKESSEEEIQKKDKHSQFPISRKNMTIERDDHELYAPKESRSKFSIFDKKPEKPEKSEKHEKIHNIEQDDELMSLADYLTFEPKVTQTSVYQIKPTVGAKTESQNEEDRKRHHERSNFTILSRKEGEKTEGDAHFTKTATRSGFSILNRKNAHSDETEHARKELRDLFSKWYIHKYLKGENQLYGLRDWKKGDKDSTKAGLLGLDDEDNELRILGNLMNDGAKLSKDALNRNDIKIAHDVHDLTRKRNFLGH